jgi:hypothetical protein
MKMVNDSILRNPPPPTTTTTTTTTTPFVKHFLHFYTRTILRLYNIEIWIALTVARTHIYHRFPLNFPQNYQKTVTLNVFRK